MHLGHDRVRQQCPAMACILFLNDPATTWSLPAIRASKPSFATSAGSSFSLAPSLVSSMPARWKNSVSVAPGMSTVMVTPESFNSLRIACANEVMKAFEAPYTARNGAGMVPAIDEVNSTLPPPARTMSLITCFARCTGAMTFKSDQIQLVFERGFLREIAAHADAGVDGNGGHRAAVILDGLV